MAVDLMDLTWKLGMLVASEKCRLCRPRYHSQAEIGISSWETSRNPDGAETVITHEIWNPALLAQIISTWPIPACYGGLDSLKFQSIYLMKRKKLSWQLNWSVCLMQLVGIGQRLELPGKRRFRANFFAFERHQLFIARCGETRRATFLWRVGAGSQNALIKSICRKEMERVCDFVTSFDAFKISCWFVLWNELDLNDWCGWRGFDFFSLWT